MKQSNLILIGVIVLVVLGGGFFLMKGSQAPSQPAAMQESPTPEAMMESKIDETAKTFTVTGSSFSFDVKEIVVNKGDTVSITFKNAEGMHDWKLDEFNASTQKLQAGEEETVTFVADQTGTFEYYCSVGQHRQNGMVGNLIVQ